MKVVFIMQALNMFSFHWYTNVALLSFGVALTGLCYGAGFSVFPATATDLYGMKNFGLNYGLVFTGWGVGGIIGPITAAAIFDATNSYNLAYTIAGALLILTILIAFTFKVKAGSS